jgi:DNA-nicking Smr family endonuclease
MSRRRQLSDEDQALWAGFARSITPLRQSRKTAGPTAKTITTPTPDKPTEHAAAAPAVAPSRPKTAAVVRREAAPPAASPPLAPLGRRLKQRVARGREPIDARIDLHGMTQRQAHAALLRFLHRTQADGAKTVLVVTGKGLGRLSSIADHTGESERGVLRRQVPLWLALPEFRLLIVGFDDAHVGHGGQGALYVRLRRRQ